MSASESLGRQFFHGTSDVRVPGELIDPSVKHETTLGYGPQNDPRAFYMTTHSPYTTANTNGIEHARQYADLHAKKTGRDPHVYQVEPTGEHWPDRHPGAFVTRSPVRVVVEQ